jgi:rhamnose transport system substrate-binding protein
MEVCMKKILMVMLSLILSATMMVSLSGCGESLEGSHVFMFKSSGNAFGELMYDGFKEYIESKGGTPINKSPSETTVQAQVKLIDELITQKVASITISTNGDTGYDQVIQKAKNAGIKVVSVDSKLSKDLRVTHIDPTSQELIGQSLIHAAVLIAMGIDYPSDGNLKTATETALASYTGDKIKFGVLSASIDTPVQNGWIAQMNTELSRSIYVDKVDTSLDIKYGNDDPTVSNTQAQAFISDNTVDVIISPTTVGMAAAGELLSTSNSTIKLTGLGLPSEMQGFMPKLSTQNAFDYVCPYMMLWDVIDLGRVAAAAAYQAKEGNYTGAIDSTLTVSAFGEYSERNLTTIAHDDGGSLVVIGTPYVFYKDNMATWIPKL